MLEQLNFSQQMSFQDATEDLYQKSLASFRMSTSAYQDQN
jgi:hypothetical protein